MAKIKKLSQCSLIFKLAVSFLLLIGVTTAWFLSGKNTGVNTLGLDVVKTVNVSVRDKNNAWSDKLEITKDDGGNVAITEFSGNGKQLFGPVAVSNQVVSFYPVTDNGEGSGYIDFTLDFKSNGPVDIYLGKGSDLIVDSFTTNLNENGVSKNYIVGAVRVAMWCVDDDTQSVIWAPNSTYQYDSSTKKVNTAGTVESAYKYAVDENVANIKTIQTTGASGVADNGRFVWGNLNSITITDMQPVMTLTPEDGTEQIKTMRVRLWVEGTDREAVKDFIGGKFKIKLNFTAVPKEGVEAE